MKILIFICFAHGDMKITLKMGATQKYDTLVKLQKKSVCTDLRLSLPKAKKYVKDSFEFLQYLGYITLIFFSFWIIMVAMQWWWWSELDRWKMTTRLSSRPLRMSQAAQFNSAELSQGVCFKVEILYFLGGQSNISSVVEF